ncbi:MAG: hypothetical protein HY002_05705 [Candidatus Rokubacteria bacterium]|nr:hypothetical protein [Candidatus Rokubacteria bacterium]
MKADRPARERGGRGAAASRRDFLATLRGGFLLLSGCGDRRRAVTGSEVVASEPLAFNVHPLGGGFQSLQQDALRTIGPPWIRVTLGLVTETDAARPYVRMGPNVLGLVADFRLGPIDAREWPDLLEAALRRYPQIRRAELLNEPEHFNKLSPARYVQEFLRPGYERIRDRFPGVAVVAAAPVGDRKKGPDQFRRLTEAGADEFCDFRAVHVYDDDDRALRTIAGATGRPILVTETGTNVPGHHVRWYADVVPRVRQALGADEVFWYVLLESPALAGGKVPYSYTGSSVIAAVPDAAGQPQAAPGSALYPLLARHPAARRR